MEKKIRNYKCNLIIILICFILLFVFNTHLITSGDIIKFLYALVVFVLGILTLLCFDLSRVDLKKSGKVAVVIGPVMSAYALVEGFMYGQKLIVNFRVAILFILIGGLLILTSGIKIIKNKIY